MQYSESAECMVINLLEDEGNEDQMSPARCEQQLRETDSTSENSEETVHLAAAKILMDLKSSATPSSLETTDKERTPTVPCMEKTQVKSPLIEERLPPGVMERAAKKDITCSVYRIEHPNTSYETWEMGRVVTGHQSPKEVVMVKSLHMGPYRKQYAVSKILQPPMDHYNPEPLVTSDDPMVNPWGISSISAESHVHDTRHALGSIVLHPGVRRMVPYSQFRLQNPHPHPQLSSQPSPYVAPYVAPYVRTTFQYSHCAPHAPPGPPVHRVHHDLLARSRMQPSFPQQPAAPGSLIRYFAVRRPGPVSSTSELGGHWWSAPDLGVAQGFQPF